MRNAVNKERENLGFDLNIQIGKLKYQPFGQL